ncbi:CsbD family protein [Desertimonas flava]|uniref:CsbD family protein n=1 Tax=Desertimonas flava TaxID=2064846 RepID=UPI000E356B34|nr:CsbD family protein [Desertimonas flava]
MSNMDQAKGRIKQAAGDLTDDDDLKREGEIDEKGGKVKDALDSAKEKLDDAVDAVKDKFKDR